MIGRGFPVYNGYNIRLMSRIALEQRWDAQKVSQPYSVGDDLVITYNENKLVSLTIKTPPLYPSLAAWGERLSRVRTSGVIQFETLEIEVFPSFDGRTPCVILYNFRNSQLLPEIYDGPRFH